MSNLIIKSKIKAIDYEHLRKLIYNEIELNGFECDLNFIDTSDITDMSYLFYISKFNGDISKWNTKNVIDMRHLFYKSNFDGDISNWDIQNVKIINNIFKESKSINIPYWAKIEDYNERMKAYQSYHAKKEKNLLLNSINESNKLIIKNKDIIKI